MNATLGLPFGDPVSESTPSPRRRLYSVSELTAEVRALLESRFTEIWVEGEISNCRVWSTGHLYCTLKDSTAQLRAVMFRSTVRYLKFKPVDGQHVVVRGRVSVYDPKGEYQIVCEHMEPQGLGALQLAFEQLKRRLEAEGLFDAGRKRLLPSLPRRIGVVTSLDGAALRDIITVLERRYPNVHLVIRPARVQGEGAADDLARALAQITRVPDIDVIILGRGGGSIEDLWAFNEERLARAIVASPVPIIAAVGHEVDYTIADFVADVRAPTPSAAAEIVVTRKEEFSARIGRMEDHLRTAVRSSVARRLTQVRQLETRPTLAGIPARVAVRGRHVAELTYALARAGRRSVTHRERQYSALRLQLEARDLRRRMAVIRARSTAAGDRLNAVMARVAEGSRARLQVLGGRLGNLNPLAVLARGYAVCWNADRTSVIRDAATVGPGAGVRVTLHQGELECEVTRRDIESDR